MPPGQMVVLAIFILLILFGILQGTSGLGTVLGLGVGLACLYWFWNAVRQQAVSRRAPGAPSETLLILDDTGTTATAPCPSPARSGRSQREIDSLTKRIGWAGFGLLILLFVAANASARFFTSFLEILPVLAVLFFVASAYWYWSVSQRNSSSQTADASYWTTLAQASAREQIQGSGGNPPTLQTTHLESFEPPGGTAATSVEDFHWEKWVEGFHWGKCLSAVVIFVSGAGLVWLGFRSDILAAGVSGGGLVALGCSGAIFSSFWRRYDGLPWYQRATIVAPKAILMIIYYLARLVLRGVGSFP